MAEDYDQSRTEPPGGPEQQLFISGVEFSAAPPLDLDVDSPELRYQKLTHIVSDYACHGFSHFTATRMRRVLRSL